MKCLIDDDDVDGIEGGGYVPGVLHLQLPPHHPADPTRPMDILHPHDPIQGQPRILNGQPRLLQSYINGALKRFQRDIVSISSKVI